MKILLRQEFIQNADLIAYKGTIERDLLHHMGFKSINLEILGCEKYDQLLTKYGIVAKCCPIIIVQNTKLKYLLGLLEVYLASEI
jgi:hypothetical protein